MNFLMRLSSLFAFLRLTKQKVYLLTLFVSDDVGVDETRYIFICFNSISASKFPLFWSQRLCYKRSNSFD